MDSKLTLKVFCALAALSAAGFAVADDAAGDNEMTDVVQTDDGNGDLTNQSIKGCDEEQQDACPCSESANEDKDPASSDPGAECVKFNIAMGRTRYSALTKSIMLQLNELTPNSALYSPSGFKVVAGFAVNSVSRVKNASGAPKYVTLTSTTGVPVTFEFADGESVGAPLMTTDNLADGRLAMVDAQGWATASDPAYYDYLPGDGARWRFGAASLSPDYMQFVEHQTPEGRVETRQDLGLEIIRDEEGGLRQVVTPAWVADFLVTGQDAYDLKVYPNDVSCIPGTRTDEGFLVIAQDAVPDVVWEFRNPEPGVMRDLQVTKKRGTVSEAWLYKYVEDMRDFTLVYPNSVKQIRLERYSADDKKSMLVRRSVLGADGKAVSVREKLFDTSGKVGRVVKSVRDPGGLDLTRTYSYIQEGACVGLRKETVEENGSWTRYEYDDQRRVTAKIRPWLDAPTNAPVNQCDVTRYSYVFVDPADFLHGNDNRSRTEIEEICGIEVARTYYAYPANALGQVQEIEERAAFQGAPYGHASNRRTVKTYYAPSAAAHLAGRLASITYPGSKVEEYGYEYGTFNAATFAFAVDADGGAWRETVTTSYGANSGVQTLRSARVWDEKGREVLNESYVEDGAAFALIGWKRMSYDLNGKLVETTYSDGRIETATWGANCCGKESETSAEGIITVYGYNELKQKVSETKKGLAADGSDDITTLYVYDLENRLLSTAVTNFASGRGYVASRNAYDAVGRLTNAVDRLGNDTVTAYDVLATSVHRPNGVTIITERYIDGQTSHMLENGAVKQSYAHGVSPDGARWTLSADGPLPAITPLSEVADLQPLILVLDFPWQLQTADPLGRTVAICQPGFGGSALVTSNAYDISGDLLSTTQYASSLNPINHVILSKNLYSYDAAGNRAFTALDLNTNGVIDLEGPDRLTGSSSAYEKDASNFWWSVSHSWVYPEFNSSAAITTSVSRIRLTELGAAQDDDGVQISHAETLDVRGNTVVSETRVDRTARKVTQITALPTSVHPAIQVKINGLLKTMVSSAGVTNKFDYDLLGRQTAKTDGRGNTSLVAYNPQGLMAYTEDAATNRTTFAYDALGRRTEEIDALGNITYRRYDAGNHVVAKWGASYPVAYVYDTQGRMTEMGTYRGKTEIKDYESFVALASAFDTTRWLYENATGLLTNKLYADGKGPSYTYTADGKLASRLWARGILTSYAYDASGALVGIDYSDCTPDVLCTFDRLGNQLSAVSSVSTNLFAYSPDTLELIAETQNGEAIVKTRDSVGREAGLFLGDDYGVEYLYDESGCFKKVVAKFGEPAITNTYLYVEGSDLLAGWSAGPLTVAKSYESHRDLIASVSNHVNQVNPVVISAYDYVNDALGRRVSRQDSGLVFSQSQPNTFGYNQRSEVTSAVMYTNAYGYVYDPMGNRVFSSANSETNTYVANALNQYTNITSLSNSLSPSCDSDGNMIFDGKEWHYIWNGENRLISASNATHVIAYTYDHRGRTISKVVDDSVYTYLWDDHNIIVETMDNGQFTITNSYVWGMDISGTLQGAGGVGGLLIVCKNGALYYSLSDANDNITEYITSTGSVVAHREYSCYGEILMSAETVSFTHWWSSKPFCSVSGLNDYQLRKCSSATGRWLSRDPFEEEIGSANLYGFISNDPVSGYDLLGLLGDNCRTERLQWNINDAAGKLQRIAFGQKANFSFQGSGSVSRKMCEVCCPEAGELESVAVKYKISAQLNAAIPVKLPPQIAAFISIMVTLSGSISGDAGWEFEPCEPRNFGSGCVTVSGSAGVQIQTASWIKFATAYAYGQASVSCSKCLKCSDTWDGKVGCYFDEWKCHGSIEGAWGAKLAGSRGLSWEQKWSQETW